MHVVDRYEGREEGRKVAHPGGTIEVSWTIDLIGIGKEVERHHRQEMTALLTLHPNKRSIIEVLTARVNTEIAWRDRSCHFCSLNITCQTPGVSSTIRAVSIPPGNRR